MVFDLTRNGKRLFIFFTGEPGTYGNGSPLQPTTLLMFTEALPTQGKIETKAYFRLQAVAFKRWWLPMLGDKVRLIQRSLPLSDFNTPFLHFINKLEKRRNKLTNNITPKILQ